MRSMRALFYIGAMVCIFAIAFLYWGYTVAGAVTMCFGVAWMMIGFLGIIVNFLVSNNINPKRL